jgi:hypothetical protein
MPPDATAALWQIERLRRPDSTDTSTNTFSSIQMPPMFECAWRWAIAQSTIDRRALQGFASIRAATRGAAGTWPWLCWQGAAAKAINPANATASTEELVQLISSVAEKTSRMTKDDAVPILALHAAFPPEVANTAQQALAVMQNSQTGRSSDIATDLAVALSMPNTALFNRLKRTSDLLDEVSIEPDALKTYAISAETGRFNIGPTGLDSAPAPALARRIVDPEDSNRKRFGGAARSSGFEVSATFDLTSNRNWVSISIIVTGEVPDDTVAQVYRHDSFKPKMREVRFTDGVAKHKVTAWGGFTVGIWIPDVRVELELDLSKIKDAPRIIQDR